MIDQEQPYVQKSVFENLSIAEQFSSREKILPTHNKRNTQ
jgi:hypothetical protein